MVFIWPYMIRKFRENVISQKSTQNSSVFIIIIFIILQINETRQCSEWILLLMSYNVNYDSISTLKEVSLLMTLFTEVFSHQLSFTESCFVGTRLLLTKCRLHICMYTGISYKFKASSKSFSDDRFFFFDF